MGNSASNPMIYVKKMRLVTILAVLLVAFGCDSRVDNSNTSVNGLTEAIQSELPIGSSRLEVEEFLRKRGIRFRDEPLYSEVTPMGETHLDAIIGYVNQESWLFGNDKIIMEFYFDKESKLLVRFKVWR